MSVVAKPLDEAVPRKADLAILPCSSRKFLLEDSLWLHKKPDDYVSWFVRFPVVQPENLPAPSRGLELTHVELEPWIDDGDHFAA